jgi:peptidoglycan/xylan/chitin deacetylase (PgdA/CDA1 family)
MRGLLLWFLLVSVSSLGAEPALILESPTDYQVIQRRAAKTGLVRIAGQAPKTDGALEIRWTLAGTGTLGWTALPAKFAGPRFTAEVEIPAGGWHALEVRQGISQAGVAHVGVGEVFVVAGQSNSANHGEQRQTPETGLVSTWDGAAWRLAEDPQPGASGQGGSFLPAFGDALARRFGVPVGVVACGIGATSVREWLPEGIRFASPPTLETRVRRLPDGQWESDGAAFERFVARMSPFGPGGFRAVLWHQGESDANQKDPARTLPGPLYRDFLERLIRESRARIGWEAPWFVAQASYHVPGDEGSEEIRAAQASLWQDGIALQGPDSDGIKGAFRERDGQGVHFSGPGLREHAARWVERVEPWLRTRLEGPLVVLTFDDSVVSHATHVAPLLLRYGFGATFFITEGFEFVFDKKHYMTWEQIQALNAAGFEIGNHTRRHAGVGKQTPEELKADVAYIESQCEAHGIPRPISFCYPGYQTSPAAARLLRERGYRFARAGGARLYDPSLDDPLLLPQAFDGRPESTLAQFQAAVAGAREGKVAVLTFHGVPDVKHPWVNTDPVKFEAYLQHLKAEGCRVIALRDLDAYRNH